MDRDLQQKNLSDVQTARVNLLQVPRDAVQGVLDVLIVGAGPGGTAAAFRAKELGLQAVVIDRDEVLSVLRDWTSPDGDPEKDKTVEHSYGVGGKAPFPVGGPLVAKLRYENRVRAGALYRRWLEVFAEQAIQVRTGMEMTRLERSSAGTWRIECVGLSTGDLEHFTARAVVLALGRGRPKPLELLGDTQGIASKLRIFLPSAVGAPVCVIGGGITATEAVIALSAAKAAAGDMTQVYWSFRGQKPRYNRTLADDFFKAAIGNGNVRLLPHSDAVAVLKGRDGSEHVAVRIDERASPGQATASTYLHFPKDRVLACIGADVPLNVLDASGVAYERFQLDLRSPKAPVTSDCAPSMRVSPILETNLAGVFLAGSMLAESYLETADANANGDAPAEVSHSNNFKPALTDGVLVVEAIHHRARGQSDAEIAKHIERRRREFDEKGRSESEESVPLARTRLGAQAKFMRLRDVKGKPEDIDIESYVLRVGRVQFGREQGTLTFPDDEKITNNHAELIIGLDTCYISTESMTGDVFVAVQSDRIVEVGQELWVGDFHNDKAHRLRVDQGASGVALSLLDSSHDYRHPRMTWAMTNTWREFGRDDVAKGDMKMSRRHFAVCAQGHRLRVADLGSCNGTYLRVPRDSAVRLQPQDVVAIGQQLLRFVGFEDAEAPPTRAPALGFESKTARPAPTPAPMPAPISASAPDAATGFSVQIINPECRITLKPSAQQTVLEALEVARLCTTDRARIGGRVQCLQACEGNGHCKLDLVRVVSGAEHLTPRTTKEKGGIYGARVAAVRAAYGLDYPNDVFRLACQCRVSGPVELELLGDTEL